jgi:hypothetical protein
MAMPTIKVEVGFDLTGSNIGPFLRLNDPVAGQLNDPDWTLGGTIFIDITDRVRNLSIGRGRNNDFDNYTSGQVSVELNNHDRAFDPLYVDSPYYGNIVPRREIKISSNDVLQFKGFIEDWNLSYSPDGDSVVTALANDSLGNLAGQTLTGFTPPEEKSGARIDRILNTSDVDWSPTARDIDVGASLLGAIPITDDVNALQYLQQIAKTEPGDLFISKSGDVTFRDRTKGPTSESLVEFGDGGIGFQSISVIYGSENLYNEVVISRTGGGTATAFDSDSQGEYGIRNLTQTELLFATDDQSLELALVYASRYSQPEYRFNSVEVALHALNLTDQDSVLGLELGDVAKVTFTPNNIGDPIIRYLEVIELDHNINPETHYVTLGFQAVDYASLVLDDAEFGKLDTYSLSW